MSAHFQVHVLWLALCSHSGRPDQIYARHAGSHPDIFFLVFSDLKCAANIYETSFHVFGIV